MASGPTTMQMLLSYQYAHSAPTPSPANSTTPIAHEQVTSSSHRRQRHLPSSDPSTVTFFYSDEWPYMTSSVNRLTHRLPETYGAHYPVAPYYFGRNEFDMQLERAPDRSTMGKPTKRAQTAGACASKMRQFARTPPQKPARDTSTMSELSLPRLSSRSPVSTASFTQRKPHKRRTPNSHTTQSDPPIVSLDSTTAEDQRLSRPATPHTMVVKENAEPEPSTRFSVRWAHCVVQDALAADSLSEFRRYVFTVAR